MPNDPGKDSIRRALKRAGTGGGGVTDHGALTGLADDDHTQYLLVDGTRALTGNLATSGTLDGRDVSVDGTKLDTIETNATADQSNAEIKTAYEANANTNAFTDAEQTTVGNQSGTNTGDEPDGTTTVKGIVELATDGENAADVVVQGNDARMSDARTPTSHTHLLADVTDSGGLAGLDTVDTSEIQANAVDNTKLADMATSTMKGRVNIGTGDPEDLSASAVRALLNVADGATANSGALADLDSVDSGQIDTQAVGTTQLGNNAVTNAKMATMAGRTFKGNNTDGTAAPTDVTSENLQAELLQFQIAPPIRFLWTDYMTNGANDNSPFSQDAISGGSGSGGTSSARHEIGVMGVVELRCAASIGSGFRSMTTADRIRGQADLFYRGKIMWVANFTQKLTRMGFIDQTGVGDSVDGAYFEVNNSSTCSIKTATNSVRTTSGTTFTLVADTWYWFEVYWTSTSSVNFKIMSGDFSTTHLDANITTNIPSSTGQRFGSGVNTSTLEAVAKDLIGLDYQGVGFRGQRSS